MPRPALGRLCASAAVAALIGTAPALPASAADPTAGAATFADLGVSKASAMLRVGGKLVVGSGSHVRVYSLTGKKLGSVTTSAPVVDLAAGPEGTVYAALPDASALAVIDIGALAETARVSGLPCVQDVAVTTTTVFAAYGCTADAAAVAVVSRTTGTSTGDLPGTWLQPPVLAATDTRLVVKERDASPARVTSYALSGGTATEVADGSVDVNGDALAVSPDGSRLVGVREAPSGLVELDADSLELVRFYATGAGPSGVAYSDDGTRLAASLSVSYDADLVVFATVDGATVARRLAVLPGRSAGAVLPNTVTFGASGTAVYSIAWNYYTPKPVARLAIISTKAAAASKVAVAVTGAYATTHGVKRFHRYSDVTVTAKIRPAGVHALSLVSLVKVSGKWKTLQTVPLTTKSSGDAVAHLGKASAKATRVMVKFPGDATLKAASATSVSFRIG